MVEDLREIFNYSHVRATCVAVRQFLRVIRRPRDTEDEKLLREQLKTELVGDDCLIGVCDLSGDLQLVFLKQDYPAWVRDMAKEGYTPEAAAAGFAERVARRPNLILRKRAA